MKINTLKSSMTLLLCACGLTACGGGGGDASGAPGALSVTPAAIGFLFPAGSADCAPITDSTGSAFPGVTTVLINGGAGGYVVTSTASDLVVGPVTQVNGVYQFTFTKVGGACSDTGMLIQVKDVRKNITTVTVSAKVSSS